MKHSKRLSAVLLAAVLMISLLPGAALADESTTTGRYAAKDLAPNTEIYAVTDAPGSDYPYYGAKWEPKGGVWYGRTAQGGSLGGSRYGLVNGDALSGESVVSYYYGLSNSYSLEYWSYIYGSALKDGKHAFLVYLNFDNEGSDCGPVVSGSYDSRLTETFQYLNTMSFPVFVRIGGEMNVWENTAKPADYIAAYRHIAQLARTYAPNAALVFAPNYSSAYRVDMDSFYPGDEYVDWVGTSLYYNRYHHSGDTARDEFYGVGQYGDALLNVQQTINLANMHRKPVIITEGGSSNKFDSGDNSDWAADRMQRAYAYMSMVYPQIKVIVSSDYGVEWEQTDYSFSNNPTVSAAYRTALAGNPTMVSSVQDTGKYYTKFSSVMNDLDGVVELAAYTRSDPKLTAVWTLDGKTVATPADYPYPCTVDFGALASGTHTMRVDFSNGESKAYTFQTKMYTASPTNDKLYVGGELQTPSIYKINGSNYFKIRDIAALLNGSSKQFEVGYDTATGSVTATSGKPYTMTGTELTGAAGTEAQLAVPSGSTIYVNGEKLDLTVYNIDGFNYFKLRDLGQALDFYVGYENGNVTISGSKGYSA